MPANPQPAASTASQPVAAAPVSAEVESALTELMAISGKPRDICLKALTAAHNIPDVAFEFLMSGYIPEGPVGGMDGMDAGMEPGMDAGMDADGADPYGDEDMVDDVEGEDGVATMAGLGQQFNLSPETMQAIQTMVSNPSFGEIRRRLIEDPAFAQNFMQQLATTQPSIYQAIQ